MSDRTKRKTAAKMPVSAHPAFPAIVALWFAALFGIGSLVLPVALFERLFAATGIASIFTAAQAPLGVTARIAIALAAALAGVVAGLAIARQVVVANTPQRLSRRAAKLSPVAASAAPVKAKRPISAHEELGHGGLDADDAADALPGRRRALSVTDESARSDFLEFAPLPGQDDFYAAHDPVEPVAPTIAMPEPEAEIEAEAEAEAALEPGFADRAPLDLATFGSAALSESPHFQASPALSFPEPAADTEEPPMNEVTRASFAPFAPPADRQVFAPLAGAPSNEPAIADLVARFARALEGRRAAAAAVPADAEPAATIEPLTEAAVEAPFAAPFAAPLAESAPPPFAAPAAPPVPHIPAALRPIGFDDHDESDDAALDLPDLDLTAALGGGSRPFAAPFAETASAAAADADDEDEDADEGYSSLLAMKNPVALPREPVRIEDESEDDGEIEPVVVFPGQAIRRAAPATDGPAREAVLHAAAARPFDSPAVRLDAMSGSGGSTAPRVQSADTERALREALDKLQKMSGLG